MTETLDNLAKALALWFGCTETEAMKWLQEAIAVVKLPIHQPAKATKGQTQ